MNTKPHRLLLCTSWFRPQLGLDMGIDLLDRLNGSGLSLVGVIGPGEEVLAEGCRRRGIRYFTLLPEFRWPSQKIRKHLASEPEFAAKLARWVQPIQDLQADLGVLYFATWIPPGLLQATDRGWVNFHPAPLPQLRGFLPEDFALLWGWKTLRGTLHVATDAIDEGPVILYGPPARLSPWDTPDSVMQKVGETARACLVGGVKAYLEARATLKEQAHRPGFYADYGPFYPESFLDWAHDDHAKLHRRFQTFRGQAHRVLLKAVFPDGVWEVTGLDTHRLDLEVAPGTLLGEWQGDRLVATQEGLAVVRGLPLVRDPGLPDHLDRQNQEVIPPGRPKPLWPRRQILEALRSGGLR